MDPQDPGPRANLNPRAGLAPLREGVANTRVSSFVSLDLFW
jgi:hypothetical protein